MSNLNFTVSVPAKDVQYSIKQLDIDLINQSIRIHTEKGGEIKMEWLSLEDVFKVVDDTFINSLKKIVTTITGIQYNVTIPEADEKEIFKETEHKLVDPWVQPTGAHDAYNTGDKVEFNATIYRSIIDGNTWSPSEYPDGWVED